MCSRGKVALSRYGGVAQLVERLTGSQEVRGFESHRLHSKVRVICHIWLPVPIGRGAASLGCVEPRGRRQREASANLTRCRFGLRHGHVHAAWILVPRSTLVRRTSRSLRSQFEASATERHWLCSSGSSRYINRLARPDSTKPAVWPLDRRSRRNGAWPSGAGVGELRSPRGPNAGHAEEHRER